MSAIKGILYRSGSSHFFEATLRISRDGTFSIDAEGESKSYNAEAYEIEPRLGASRRVIHFSDGVRFETDDHDSLAQFESTLSKGALFRLVDWLEDRWPVAVGSIVGVVVFVFVFIEYAMPLIAGYLAYEVPQSVRRALSENSLDAIERYGSFEESYSMKINEASGAAFDRALALVSDKINPEYEYELRVFKSPAIGPNAFALPSGLVVATEEFVELCETEEQMVAVFLHEIAHVEMQHGLRSLIQDAGIFLVLSIALGDLSSLGGMAASLPALAIESHYSQSFEAEADLYSGRILEESGIGAEAMKEILILLHEGSLDVDIVQFFSSHPGLEERIRALESLQEGEEVSP